MNALVLVELTDESVAAGFPNSAEGGNVGRGVVTRIRILSTQLRIVAYRRICSHDAPQELQRGTAEGSAALGDLELPCKALTSRLLLKT